jgi:hypothetical protein
LRRAVGAFEAEVRRSTPACDPIYSTVRPASRRGALIQHWAQGFHLREPVRFRRAALS